MPTSPRMVWPYPAENAQPWFDAFVDMIRAQDASAYASREDRQIIFTEGGSISWSSGSSSLSWSNALRITAAITGFTWNVQPSALTVDEGACVYVDLTRAPTNNPTLVPAVVFQVPPSDTALILCVRIGGRIYWRNGLMLNNGDTVTNIGAGQGGGGGPSTPSTNIQSALGAYVVPGTTIVGDVVRMTGASSAVAADSATHATGVGVFGLIIAKPTIATATVLYAGEHNGMALLSAGTVYYLGAAGGLLSVAPVGVGQVVQRVGIAKSATELVVNLGEPVLL